ncbi:hypothetical protein AVEN_987-1 [Araneus ventricosus]|uniref:Uncharacterized protein n=1 Tax=Araneus ventricosus TaxID=182803 RepID=A0A4Y2CWD0_ARAVE|nr:hypothetical protein AVEN_987-1 [Araneus ventricosus]
MARKSPELVPHYPSVPIVPTGCRLTDDGFSTYQASTHGGTSIESGLKSASFQHRSRDSASLPPRLFNTVELNMSNNYSNFRNSSECNSVSSEC